jgi:hypothetical protein
LSLLNYWRDEAAHGVGTESFEDEANVSLLLLLLRYAVFADTRWEELTAPWPRVSGTFSHPVEAASPLKRSSGIYLLVARIASFGCPAVHCAPDEA